LLSYPALAETFPALAGVNFAPRLRWLLDLPQPRAIAGGANNLGQTFARSSHRNQSSKTSKEAWFTLRDSRGWPQPRNSKSIRQTAASISTEKPISVSRSLTVPLHTITPQYEHGFRLSSGGKSSHADGCRSDQRN
jgi:hypothetical protein